MFTIQEILSMDNLDSSQVIILVIIDTTIIKTLRKLAHLFVSNQNTSIEHEQAPIKETVPIPQMIL